MSFTPFARFRNFTIDNFKTCLDLYPDMVESMSWKTISNEIEKSLKGYKKTAYQQSCQLGLEDRSSEEFKVQDYLFSFDDENLKKYLVFWFKTYYAPNPYVQSEDEPFIIFCSLADEILLSTDLSIDYHDFFERRIGGKSEDILLNTIKMYGAPIRYKKEGLNDIFFITEENKEELELELNFIKENFPIVEHENKKTFFDRYKYKNFRKFYDDNNGLEIVSSLDWKNFIFDSISKINNISEKDEMISTLISQEECRSLFNHGYPILYEIFDEVDSNVKRRDNNGYVRCYSDHVTVGNRKFLISKEWFNYKGNRVGTKLLFKKWIELKLGNSVHRVTGAINCLYYGVPGSGKSHEVRKRYCGDEQYIERIIFHPDYTNSDFIGQIIPKVENDKLKYLFIPGAFTRILKKAEKDSTHMYYLIIEELNRGNAPAIFGDVFQLLDRKDKYNYPVEVEGESEYGITNFDIAEYVYGDEDHIVKIPSNLTILGTMNTSDQNIFALDTAFQRRWEMCPILNDVYKAEHADETIIGTSIKWGACAAVINEIMINSNEGFISTEDKRLGAYFVKKNDLENDSFYQKVVKYLWDDAFKMDKEAVFKAKYKSLDEVIFAFTQSTGDKLEEILVPEVYEKMKKLTMSNSHKKND